MTSSDFMINANLTAMWHFDSKYVRMADRKEQIETEKNYGF